MTRKRTGVVISAIDLFCGAGGLTHGLIKAGVRVEAGIDIDPNAEHAYEANNEPAQFKAWDVSRKNSASIGKLFAPDAVRLLAGCAPCQPFSKMTNGLAEHRAWNLLDHFRKLVLGIGPELVTMENVPELATRGREVFDRFREALEDAGYSVDWKVVNCSDYGAPQLRKRLVLLASRLGQIRIPNGRFVGKRRRTVRQAIGMLPSVEAGEAHRRDRVHIAALLSPTNMKRIAATPHDGGSKADWPRRLQLACHRKASGARYVSIYGRMCWDKPAPTMTTLCNGFGNGRFGHPDQDRAITLREAALLQSFPRGYDFWPRDKRISSKAVARLIGNAVPPALGEAIGRHLVEHVKEASRKQSQT